ncbi:MAG TPA: methyltransferase domain-containing protein [Anaeromyxobacteraceae bacterium]|jgi:trans-aconitate 2-methyltransferase
MAIDPWDPDQYALFRDERTRPFLDLLGLVRPRPGMRVLDLGCGAGELTRLAHERLGAAETLGIDRSEAMLARAAPLAGGGLRFERGDIAGASGRWDLVLSNAAIHWLPDHEALLPRLCALVGPGGQIAVQLPDNGEHPSHREARATAAEAPFREALGAAGAPRRVLAPERYAEILHGAGLAEVDVQLRIYCHLLDGPEAVVEWVKGTVLNEWRERLPEALWQPFLERYRERLTAALPASRPTLYTYRRVLFRAARPATVR